MEVVQTFLPEYLNIDQSSNLHFNTSIHVEGVGVNPTKRLIYILLNGFSENICLMSKQNKLS